MQFIKCGLLASLILGITGCTTIPTTEKLGNTPANSQIRFLPANEPKTDYREMFSKNISIDTTNTGFETIIEMLGQQADINLIIDKNIDLARQNYTMHMMDTPMGEVIDSLLKTECLGYAPPQVQKFFNGKRVPIDTLVIYQQKAQKSCYQPDRFTKLAENFPAFKNTYTFDMSALSVNHMLDMLSVSTKTHFIYQNNSSPRWDYALHIKDKPMDKIFQSILESQCLNYRKLNNKSLLIFKDPNQKDCKPLPSGSEIIVK